MSFWPTKNSSSVRGRPRLSPAFLIYAFHLRFPQSKLSCNTLHVEWGDVVSIVAQNRQPIVSAGAGWLDLPFRKHMIRWCSHFWPHFAMLVHTGLFCTTHPEPPQRNGVGGTELHEHKWNPPAVVSSFQASGYPCVPQPLPPW